MVRISLRQSRETEALHRRRKSEGSNDNDSSSSSFPELRTMSKMRIYSSGLHISQPMAPNVSQQVQNPLLQARSGGHPADILT